MNRPRGAVSIAASNPLPVAAILLRREAEGRIRSALRGYTVACSYVAQDLVSVARTKALALVVTEPWDASGVPTAPVIQVLKGEYRSVPVIAYCDTSAAALREMVPLTRAGIDAIAVRGIDDEPALFRAVVSQARRACVYAEVMEAVETLVRPDTAAFIGYCLTHASDSVCIAQAAAALGIDRKTLFNRLAKQLLPRPREILAWCRLLVAARLLEDLGRSVEHVGLAIGCGSGTALRNLFLRHTTYRPHAIRARGGMKYVLGQFVEALQRQRYASADTQAQGQLHASECGA